jgi:hypothetical protein
MNTPQRPEVKKRTLALGGARVSLYYVAVSYPTTTASRLAWQRVEKVKRRVDQISVFRVKATGREGGAIIAFSEKEAAVKSARRLLGTGGEPHEPSDQEMTQLALRASRVLNETQISDGNLLRHVHYGEAGAKINPGGRVEPCKRPQG